MHKKFEKAALSIIERYKTLMNLTHFTTNLVYEPKQQDPMGIKVFLPYYEAEISYGDLAVSRWEENRLEWLVRHELTHIPLWRYMELAESRKATRKELNYALESTVDFIARYKVWDKV